MQKIPSKISVNEMEYDIITKDYGRNPCDACGSHMQAECWGCHELSTWEAQFKIIPYELQEITKTYNQTHAIDADIEALKQEITKLQQRKDAILDSIGEIVIN